MNNVFTFDMQDLDRYQQIEFTAKKIERMRLARFYFASEDFGPGSPQLPDTRSYNEYFAILERNDKYPEKTKIRKTIDDLVCVINNLKVDLHLSAEEEILFYMVLQSFSHGFINDFNSQIIARWPRIYVYYNENNPDILKCITVPELYKDGRIKTDMESMFLPDQYKNDGTISSEIDYNAERTIALVTYKDHPPNKFNYRLEQINLEFIRNLTPDIRGLINKKIKAQFKSKHGSGFSGHHIIPRKKLEVFYKLYKQYKIKARTLRNDSGIYNERLQQYTRMEQLARQFRDHGLLEAIKPYKPQTTDMAVSPAGNIFYGPQIRADDEQSGFIIDNAAALVLSKDDYKSVADLDTVLNDFFRSYEFELTDKFFQSRTIDHFIDQVIDKLFSEKHLDTILYNVKYLEILDQISRTFLNIATNHGLKTQIEAIPFDPRLVDQTVSEGAHKWIYRNRKMAERNLTSWFDKILQEVSKELQVELVYDLNFNPVVLRSDVDKHQQSIILKTIPIPKKFIPKYVASSTEIFQNVLTEIDKNNDFAEEAPKSSENNNVNTEERDKHEIKEKQ